MAGNGARARAGHRSPSLASGESKAWRRDRSATAGRATSACWCCARSGRRWSRSASNQTMRDARSAARACCTTGSKVTEPGRKSSARLSPALSWMSAWISGSGSVRARSGSRFGEHDLRHRQPERPGDLPRHELGHQCPCALPGATKLQHIQPVVVGFDDRGQRAAFAKRSDVAGDVDGPDRLARAVHCGMHRGSRHGTRITRMLFYGTRIRGCSSRDADFADRAFHGTPITRMRFTGRGSRGSIHGTRISRYSCISRTRTSVRSRDLHLSSADPEHPSSRSEDPRDPRPVKRDPRNPRDPRPVKP